MLQIHYRSNRVTLRGLKSTHWIWLIAALLAAAWHFLWFWVQPLGLFSPDQPRRIEVSQMSPTRLDAIRQKWKNIKEPQQLLLNQDPARTKEAQAPPHARYFSDRNTSVEKEQRARKSNVIPRSAQHPNYSPDQANKTSLTKLGIPALRDLRPSDLDHGDQALSEKNLTEGNENLLNTRESIFYSFYARVYEAIGPLWQSRIREIPNRLKLSPGDYTTTVEVVFDESGNVVDVIHIQDSKIREFDDAVDFTWSKTKRFPNPPRGLLDFNRQVRMGLTFTVQVGSTVGLGLVKPEWVY